jgi:mannose-binding lectin 1
MATVYFTFAVTTLSLVLLLLPAPAYGAHEMDLVPPFYPYANRVGNWRISGHASASDEYIRLTQQSDSQKGLLWSLIPSSAESWEVEFLFKISGGAVGADGLAFWYTEEPGHEGNVFGAVEPWKGLGIFFDTFDNGGERTSLPLILGMHNDGTRKYHHQSDGEESSPYHCQQPLRNPTRPTIARVKYHAGKLSLNIDASSAGGQEGFVTCFTADMQLASYGYYGFSAATGGLHDIHEILGFRVLDTPGQAVTSTQAPAATEPRATQPPINLDKELAAVSTSTHVYTFTELAKIVQSLASQLDHLEDDAVEERREIRSVLNNILESQKKKPSTQPTGLSDVQLDAISEKTTESVRESIRRVERKVLDLASSLSTRLQIVSDAQRAAEDLSTKSNQLRTGVDAVREQQQQLQILLSQHNYELSSSVTEQTSMSFWIFFGFFQVFFLFAMFFWKKYRDDLNRSGRII